MTREQEIRHECLLQLYGSKELPISAEHIIKVAKRQGFDYGHSELRGALFFLADQGFATRLQDPATGAITYRITAKGILHYENEDQGH